MPNDIKKKSNKHTRSTQTAVGINPRMTFGFIFALSFLTLGLGFWQIRTNIRAPFQMNNEYVEAENLQPSTVGDTQVDITALQQKDTDQDGLTDYEELYVYNTSPYLPDSDSDGFSDSEELKNNHDPNCPAGQNCRGISETGEVQTDTTEAGINDDTLNLFGGSEINNQAAQNYADLLEEGQAGQTSSEDSQALEALGQLSVDQIRELLKESGQIDQATLDAIDDETLMRVYQETLGQQ